MSFSSNFLWGHIFVKNLCDRINLNDTDAARQIDLIR